jgi:hypothetical protein
MTPAIMRNGPDRSTASVDLGPGKQASVEPTAAETAGVQEVVDDVRGSGAVLRRVRGSVQPRLGTLFGGPAGLVGDVDDQTHTGGYRERSAGPYIGATRPPTAARCAKLAILSKKTIRTSRRGPGAERVTPVRQRTGSARRSRSARSTDSQLRIRDLRFTPDVRQFSIENRETDGAPRPGTIQARPQLRQLL